MANLYLDRAELKFEEVAGSLVIRNGDKIQTSLPLALIDNVIIAADLSCSARTLLRITEAGVGLVLLNQRRPALSVTLELAGGRNALRRLAQLRASADPAWCLRWSQRLVESKLCLALRLLSLAIEERPTLRFESSRAATQIRDVLTKVRASQHPVSSLMGFEGAAASAYFSAYTKLFPPSLRFTSRNRRPPLDPVNACLSLGYTLVHAEATGLCATFGLDPSLGFFHTPQPGRDSLACDLTETERSHVDTAVWTLFRDRTIRLEHFRLSHTSCLLGKAGREIFYREFQGVLEVSRKRLHRRFSHLARALDNRQHDNQTDDKAAC
jgi:CRISPR-associated protein Cas1